MLRFSNFDGKYLPLEDISTLIEALSFAEAWLKERPQNVVRLLKSPGGFDVNLYGGKKGRVRRMEMMQQFDTSSTGMENPSSASTKPSPMSSEKQD